jgi:hypothetical protein
MTLIRFRDHTYSRPCIVSARDLVQAFEHSRRLVALRQPDGTKFSDDGVSLREGKATSILLGYIPDAACAEARAVLGNELPDMCVAVLQPQEVLIGIRRDERGYYQMYDGTITGDAARIVADRINEGLKVAPQQREAMLVGSMMGWNCPAARPSSPIHDQAVRYSEEEAAS